MTTELIESVLACDIVVGDSVTVTVFVVEPSNVVCSIFVDGMSMSVINCIVAALLVCDVASSLLPSCKVFVIAEESVSLELADTVDEAVRSSVVLTSVECSVIGLFVTMGEVMGSIGWTMVVTSLAVVRGSG